MKRKRVYLIVTVLLFFTVVAFLFLRKENEVAIVPSKASVNYSDKKFTIENQDTLDFVHTDISIDEYYKLRDINLQMGEKYTIWQTEFLHHNGKHYPENRNPIKFSIWCEMPHGRNGFYSKRIR
ncbi:hypothetical protein [Maribellus maritimus]|uniref:hypothetical protein n=1 Tax=Maribellus maritimus TaxID=2870838 RepID=UPI001EEC9AF4|nr:hypothetical protein [Maribellus maritimus]MCG6188573.1 hypothetical protein [Maribellus maritimus]